MLKDPAPEPVPHQFLMVIAVIFNAAPVGCFVCCNAASTLLSKAFDKFKKIIKFTFSFIEYLCLKICNNKNVEFFLNCVVKKGGVGTAKKPNGSGTLHSSSIENAVL
jgi:hypothetical protein